MDLTTAILTMMNEMQPAAPWKDTYPTTAAVFARVAADSPLFKGKKGIERTAALFVSVAWFESRFDPKAIGDEGRSICAFQVGVSNLKALGVDKERMLDDIEVCTRAARTMMLTSFNVCHRFPLLDRLGHYAYGRGRCGGPSGEGLRESRHRMHKARWIFDRFEALSVKPV